MRYYLIFLTLIFAKVCCAWNSDGHMLVAQIAYDQLTLPAKTAVNRILKQSGQKFLGTYNILAAAAWADRIKQYNITRYNNWHFIQLPFTNDGTSMPANKKIGKYNLVKAIQHCEQILKKTYASRYQQAFCLRFLIHLVGDAHQPMHCATLINRQFPYGDSNGNQYTLQYGEINNLHALWDNGAGVFQLRYHDEPLRYWQVRIIARNLEHRYDPKYFGKKINDLNAAEWVQESFNLAKNFAYSTPQFQQPSAQYINHAREITEQQIVLAGYRLAKILNMIYGNQM